MTLMRSVRLLLLAGLLHILSTPGAHAENAQPWDELEAERDAREEVDAEELNAQKEMGSSVYGRVTSIDPGAKTLSLIPTDQVENVEAEDNDEAAAEVYHFRPDSTVTGIDSFGDIAAGDYVTVDFYTYHGRNRISGIDFDKHGENRAETPASQPSEERDLVDIGGPPAGAQNASGDLVG